MTTHHILRCVLKRLCIFWDVDLLCKICSFPPVSSADLGTVNILSDPANILGKFNIILWQPIEQEGYTCNYNFKRNITYKILQCSLGCINNQGLPFVIFRPPWGPDRSHMFQELHRTFHWRPPERAGILGPPLKWCLSMFLLKCKQKM